MYVNLTQGSIWHVASSRYTLTIIINYYSVIIALISIIIPSHLLATSEEALEPTGL